MKKIIFCIFLLMPSAFAQLSMNPGAPDYMYHGKLLPAIGQAGDGDTHSCVVTPYEAYVPGMTPSSTMLIMKAWPCSVVVPYSGGSYTLQAPIHIQSVHCWIGTSANARMELVTNLQIWIKDAFNVWHMMFDQLCEYDKHQDVVGNTDKMWTYPQTIDIPAGAVVNVYPYVGGLIFCGADFWHIEGPSSATGTLLTPTLQPNNTVIDPNATWDHCAVEYQWRIYGTGK